MSMKFTGKAICLIYSLFLFNAVCVGPAYCMEDPEEKSCWQKLASSFKRRTELWEAERNGGVLQFVEEGGKVAQFKSLSNSEELEEEKKATVKNRGEKNIPTITHPSSLTVNVEAEVAQFKSLSDSEELEEEKKATVKNRGAKNTPVITHPTSLIINVEAITDEDRSITDEDGFLILKPKRISITLFSNTTSEDEKKIRTYFESGPYHSLHLTFKKEEAGISVEHRLCSAAASAICPDIKEFIFEGPFIRKALLMIWNHCPNVETLSLTSPDLREILKELCTVDAEMLKKLTHVVLVGKSSPELLSELRSSFPSIKSIKGKENVMAEEKDLTDLLKRKE